jgi:chemotaxis protein CheD
MNIVVGVSDMKASKDPRGSLITYSLGSCIGIAIYDPLVKAGGLVHFMLPESSLDPEKAAQRPFMFADTAIPHLFKAVYAFGGEKRRMRVIVVGGSQVMDQNGFFNIGKRNEMAVRKIFHRNNVVIDYADTGGNSNRTIRMSIANGETRIKVSGQSEIII